MFPHFCVIYSHWSTSQLKHLKQWLSLKGWQRKSVFMYPHILIISIPRDTRIYKERKSMHRFGGRGTYFAFFFFLSLKRLRSPSAKSERELGTGSSELRVKALLDTTPKEKPMKKHEHKSGRRHFSALGCLIWISHSLLPPDTNILFQLLFRTVLQPSFSACKVSTWPFIQLQRAYAPSQ